MALGTKIGHEALATLASLSLAACGGGASSTATTSGAASTSSPAPTPAPAPAPVPAPTPSPSAAGLYSGNSSNGRTIRGILLDSGSFWVLYSGVGNPSVIEGGIQGTSTSALGGFSSTNARDFNLVGQGINDATISASYIAKQSLTGVVTYTRISSVVSFNSSYDPLYDLTPSIANLVGSYTGTAAVVNSTESASGTVTSAGALSGRGVSGCTFAGTIAPHSTGNVYDVSVTFGGGVCSNGTNTVTGVAYFDPSNRRLYSAAVNSDRSNGFIFVGLKQ